MLRLPDHIVVQGLVDFHGKDFGPPLPKPTPGVVSGGTAPGVTATGTGTVRFKRCGRGASGRGGQLKPGMTSQRHPSCITTRQRSTTTTTTTSSPTHHHHHRRRRRAGVHAHTPGLSFFSLHGLPSLGGRGGGRAGVRHTLRSSSDLCSQNRRKERKRGGGEPWPRFNNGTSPLCVC